MKLSRFLVIFSALALALVMVSPVVGQDRPAPDDPDRGVGAEERPPGEDVQESRFDGGPGADDQVILDDLIVDGSLCVGFDCVNGESFGFDTLRLKENNLRIKFQDTSTSASFPSNDWQITANETSNGGANKFSIDDIDGGRTPFTIEAGAPSHSLYVDDGGRIGLGTSTPVVEVHVKDGDTPTVRLEQDGSSGFTPQTWDMAGNETNFFIRDATNGSALPFRIQPGADSNSVFIRNNNNIGMGTSTPEAALHIRRSGVIQQRIESTDNNAVQVRFITDSENRRFLAQNASAVNQSQLEFRDNGVVALYGPTATTGTPSIVLTKSDATPPALQGLLYTSSTGALCYRSGAAWVQVTTTPATGGSCP